MNFKKYSYHSVIAINHIVYNGNAFYAIIMKKLFINKKKNVFTLLE